MTTQVQPGASQLVHPSGIPLGWKLAGNTFVPVVLANGVLDFAVANTTTLSTLLTVPVPGFIMGPRGVLELEMQLSFTNSANAKNVLVQFGGTTVYSSALTSNATLQGLFKIRNRNAYNSQMWHPGGSTPFGASTTALQTGSVDTTQSQNLTVTCQMASGSETVTLHAYSVRVQYGD